MPSSGPVITADAVMSRLRLRCFSLIFSFVSPCVQLSDSGPKRSKREVVGDGSTQPYPETQQSITLLSPRKETHLLVSEEGFPGTHKASRAKHGQINYSCANGPTARVAKEPKKTNYCSWTPPSQVSLYSQILHLYSMKKTRKQIAITLHVCTLAGFNSLIFL